MSVIWRLDPSFDVVIGFEQVQEVGAVEQLDRFALGKFRGIAVSACRDQYAL